MKDNQMINIPKMGWKEWLLRAWFAGMVTFVVFYMTGIAGYPGYVLVAITLGFISTFLIDPITSTMKYGNVSMYAKGKHGVLINSIKNFVISFFIVAVIALLHTLILNSNLGRLFQIDFTIVDPFAFGIGYQLLHYGIFLVWHTIKHKKMTSSK